MNKKSEFFALILTGIIAVILFACGGESSEPVNDGENARTNDPGNISENENASPAEERLSPPELPEIDLGGANFVIMSSDWGIPIWDQRDIFAEEETGDTINDAVYRRNSVVEARFNCKIVANQVNREKFRA